MHPVLYNKYSLQHINIKLHNWPRHDRDDTGWFTIWIKSCSVKLTFTPPVMHILYLLDTYIQYWCVRVCMYRCWLLIWRNKLLSCRRRSFLLPHPSSTFPISVWGTAWFDQWLVFIPTWGAVKGKRRLDLFGSPAGCITMSRWLLCGRCEPACSAGWFLWRELWSEWATSDLCAPGWPSGARPAPIRCL